LLQQGKDIGWAEIWNIDLGYKDCNDVYPFIYIDVVINKLFSIKWWWCSSGLWHCVDLQVDTSVSEKHSVSIFRAEASQPRRTSSSSSLSWEPEISLFAGKFTNYFLHGLKF
jgi:hypothetical protein